MKNGQESSSNGLVTESEGLSHSLLPNSARLAQHLEPTSVRNTQPQIIINLMDSESDSETDIEDDDVIFVSSQPFIPVPAVVIQTPAASNINPQNSNDIERHSENLNERFMSIMNVSEVETDEGTFQGPKCKICLKSIEMPHSTLCGHIFCKLCIFNPVKKFEKCPCCRQKLDVARIHPIYF